jgi:hypothetical protein
MNPDLEPVGACWSLLEPVGACWSLLEPVGARVLGADRGGIWAEATETTGTETRSRALLKVGRRYRAEPPGPGPPSRTDPFHPSTLAPFACDVSAMVPPGIRGIGQEKRANAIPLIHAREAPDLVFLVRPSGFEPETSGLKGRCW